MELSGSKILVTGGAVRVGRAICEMLAESDATIFCHYHSSTDEAMQLSEKYTNIHLLRGDLSRQGVAEKLVEQVVEKAGRIDVLVNNAAVFFKTPPGLVTYNDWEKLFSINLKAAFFASQIAAIQMKKQGFGKIINIGDTSGEKPWPSYLPYSITKAGIIAMTKGFARAFAPEVLVSCVNPGPVLLPEEMSEAERKMAVDNTLLKRAGSGKDIATAVRYLIEGSDYITGASLFVDGGRSIR